MADGTLIPGHAVVDANDTSSLSEILYEASVSIRNSVSLTSCDESTEVVDATFGTAVTYCWNVTNTGNTALSSLRLEDTELGFQEHISQSILPPGESVLVTFLSVVSEGLINRCVVVGTPTKSDGSALFLDEVTHSDMSEVKRVALHAQISLQNKVYFGLVSDDDACSTAVEHVDGIFATDVVYCFNITNTGETYLDNLEIWDDDIHFSEKLEQALAPGASMVVTVQSQIRADRVSEASVIGRPVLADGTEILGVNGVVASDTSSVGKLTYSAAITVDNKVVSGHDETKCDGGQLENSVEVAYKSPVVYCFTITNTGESYLGSVSIANKALTYFHTLHETLAPGQSKVVSFATFATGNVTNTVLVSGVSFCRPVAANFSLQDFFSLRTETPFGRRYFDCRRWRCRRFRRFLCGGDSRETQRSRT